MHNFHYNIFNNYFYPLCNTTPVVKMEFQDVVACLFLTTLHDNITTLNKKHLAYTSCRKWSWWVLVKIRA